jgi:hypothetical protein
MRTVRLIFIRCSIAIAACLLILGTGCASTETAPRAGGSAEHVVSCWYFGWYMCYEKAKEICGGDYRVISQKEGWGGRELRVTCS